MTRKYDSDGHNVDSNADVIRTGTILRMVSKDGGVSPFSDTTVIGIWMEDRKGNKHTYETVGAAVKECDKEWKSVKPWDNNDYRVVIELARPYLYASSIGICFNWLTGVEKFSTSPNRILDLYKVVEMSTGEAANYNQK